MKWQSLYYFSFYNVQSTTEAGASIDLSANNDESTTEVGLLAGSLDTSTRVFTLDSGNSDSVLNSINVGSKLRIDNRWFLALLTYNRHQAPKVQDYYAWDQFKNPDGTLKYPQRSINVGSLISRSVNGGASYSGNINCKMILVANLLDCDVNPWSADWYDSRVKKSLGENYNDNFRIWYNDNADHIDSNPPTNEKSLVQYVGVLEQALLDLSEWVEKEKAPAQSTNYKIVDTQVQELLDEAENRGGIQPIVNLTVNGGDKIEIKAGQKHRFVAYATNAIKNNMNDLIKRIKTKSSIEGNEDFSLHDDIEKDLPSHDISLEDLFCDRCDYEELRLAINKLTVEEKELIDFIFFKNNTIQSYAYFKNLCYSTACLKKKVTLKKIFNHISLYYKTAEVQRIHENPSFRFS